jgi:hypothetical protein
MRGRGSANSDEFIREVDEAVRQDRWLKLWNEYGAWIVGAALAVVIGTAAGVGWRSWQESQRQAEAERYMAATQLLRQNRPAEAAAAFQALAQESDSGYAVLAHLQAAHALGQAGDEAGKLAMLRQLADDGAAAPMYRELGDLLALQQQFGTESADNLTSQLESLTSTDNPWRYSALELIALAQMRAGDTTAARETLSTLVGDPRVPPDLGRRAAELLSAAGGPVDEADAAQDEIPDEPESSDDGGSP